MRKVSYLISWIILLSAIILYVAVLPLATVERKQDDHLFVLPPNIVRVISFQFKEIAADYAFLSVLTYLGGTRPQRDTHRYLPEQYKWVHDTLINAIALEPYFMDPYYILNSALIWDRYRVEEVNEFIAKGADKRTWDSMLPFFAGFNYYYFLDDGVKSFYYLKQASQRAGGIPFYDSLAARVAYKANRTEFAISYLEEQIKQTEIKGQKDDNLSLRLNALKAVREIEIAVESYKKLFNAMPTTISGLIKSGLLKTVPKDPYGGMFYLDHDGTVKTTSNLSSLKGK